MGIFSRRFTLYGFKLTVHLFLASQESSRQKSKETETADPSTEYNVHHVSLPEVVAYFLNVYPLKDNELWQLNMQLMHQQCYMNIHIILAWPIYTN